MTGRAAWLVILWAVLCLAAQQALAAVSVATNDGLVLTLNDDGSWGSLTVDGTPIPVLAGATGGFVVAAMEGVSMPYHRQSWFAGTPITGTATQEGGNVHLVGTADGLGFDITLTGGGPYIRADGTVTGPGSDRVFIVYFRIPVDANGWVWADDIYGRRTIDSSPSNWYFAPYAFNQARHPWLSLNPFGTITKTGEPEMGVSLSPLFYPPCAYAIQYNGNGGFWIEFELGVTPETTKHPNTGDFHFVLYKHDPEWGNRSAVKRYYEFFPQWFQKKSRGGNWLLDGVRPDNPEDFALVYLETYNWDDEWTSSHNIYTCKYQEPWCWHLDWLTEMDLEAAAEDIPANDAYYCPAKGQSIKESAQQAILSGCKNPDGTYIGPDEQSYWTDGFWECDGWIETVRYITNPDVEIANFRSFNPGRNRGQSVAYWEWYRWWGMAPGPEDEYTGLYHDSTGGFWAGWGVVHNFAPEHWATYDYSPGIYFGSQWGGPGLVCMWAPYSNVEFAKHAYEQMTLESRVVMANTFANYELFMVAPFIDMFGAGESVSWGSLQTESILRAAAYQKPVSYLGDGATEEAMLRGLLLNIYPGFRLGSDYEDYRSLYQQYMPIYNTLDAAGWEPVTNARASNTSMGLERYGPDGEGMVYFVVRAESAGATDVTISSAEMGWAANPFSQVTELLYGGGVSTSYDGDGDLVIHCGDIGAGDDRVYKVEVSATPTAPVADFAAAPTMGAKPLTVQFADLSTWNPTSWQWEFGTGDGSTEQNPSYEYQLAGIYTVSMAATNIYGTDNETKTDYVLVSTFSDVLGDYWSWRQVEACVATGVVQGYGDKTYRPGVQVARDAMAVYIARAMGLATGAYEALFEDVKGPGDPEEQWAWPWIEALARAGIVQGYTATEYRPAVIVKRDAMAVYVARALWGGVEVPTGPEVGRFDDVPDRDPGPAHWAYDEVEYCVTNGVVSGYTATEYRPDNPVDRGQMAVYVQRAFGLSWP
jgi:PKD repeat protein